MSNTIPIANLYHLLVYAWNQGLDEAGETPVDAGNCPDLNNLFAGILANAGSRLIRRGLDRSYIDFEEETPRIRGRIDFSTSEKKLARTRGKLICIYDELSADVLHNQILKATLRILRADPRVEVTCRKRLATVLDAFSVVSDLRVVPRHFHRVQLHRNNRAYRFILHVCELVHASLLPDKSSNGRRRFRDFTRNEKTMARIFESFVRNFADRHLTGTRVSAMPIHWQASDFGDSAERFLPGMITDVTIEWPDHKLILDCKYYREALVVRFDALRFRSSNLYQLHAYVTNKAFEPGWEDVEGMLLYPSNGYHFDHAFTLHGRHRIRVSTIDLNQNWRDIEATLLALLGTHHSKSLPCVPS